MFTKLRVTGAAALTAALSLAAATCPAAASVQTVTSVIDAGETDDAIVLPPKPVVRQAASGPFRLDIAMFAPTEQPDTFDLHVRGDLSSEVVEVQKGGAYVAQSTLSDIVVDSSSPEVGTQMESAEFDAVTYESTYDEDGEWVASEVVDTGLTEDELEFAEDLAYFLFGTRSVYPPGAPVGPGATWSATAAVLSGLLPAEVEMVVVGELSSLTETEYVVDMTIDSAAEGEIGGEPVRASITGRGQVTASRTNPLATAGDMTLDVQMYGGDRLLTVNVSSVYDFAEQPG